MIRCLGKMFYMAFCVTQNMGKLHNLPQGRQGVSPRSEQQILSLASISKSCSHPGHFFSTSCPWPLSPHLQPCLLPPISGPLICVSLHSNKSNYLFQWLPVLWNYEAMIELPGKRYRGPAGKVLMVAALNKLCAPKLALIFTQTAPICSRELQNSYLILVLKFFMIFRQSLCETWTKKQTVCRKTGRIQLHLLLIWKKSNYYFICTLACIITHCEMVFFSHQTFREVLRFLIIIPSILQKLFHDYRMVGTISHPHHNSAVDTVRAWR